MVCPCTHVDTAYGESREAGSLCYSNAHFASSQPFRPCRPHLSPRPPLPPHRAGCLSQIPKLLAHRLFPNSQFSMWVDAKLQLVQDPYKILER